MKIVEQGSESGVDALENRGGWQSAVVAVEDAGLVGIGDVDLDCQTVDRARDGEGSSVGKGK